MLTSPVINTPTGSTKADVSLGNVDNTSDATKNSATATLTNKTISGASNTLSNIPESAVTSLTTDLASKVTTTTTVNGHALSSNVTVTANDVLPTQTGNSGKYLTTDGTNSSWGTVAGGGGGSSTPRSTIQLNTQSNATDFAATNQTSTTTGGSFIPSGGRMRYGLDGTINAKAQSYRATGGGNNPAGGMKNIAGHLIMALGAVTVGDGVMYLRFFSDSNNPTLGTANQIGFKFIKVGGTTTSYATSGDGTTEQATSITAAIGSGNDNTFSFVQSATDVKFYVNGTLVATHSTNIPSSTALKNFYFLNYTLATSANPYNIDLNSMAITFDLL